jgi:hypothetical protein
MRLYTKYVLPRLVDLSMKSKETSRLRAEFFPMPAAMYWKSASDFTAAGFEILELKTFYQPGPRPMTYTTKASRNLPSTAAVLHPATYARMCQAGEFPTGACRKPFL